MSTEIKVPTLPESIADALVVTWHKQEGDAVARDEVLVDIETDKVVLEVPASEDGVLGKIIEGEGTTVTAHQVIGSIQAGSAASGGGAATAAAADEASASASVAAANDDAVSNGAGGQTSPSVRKLLATHGLDASAVQGSGKNGRISKEDVERHVAAQAGGAPSAASSSSPAVASSGAVAPAPALTGVVLPEGDRPEQRVPMSRMRARIAERLLQASQNTAMLTTFNEVNMQAFIDLRKEYLNRSLEAIPRYQCIDRWR